MGRLKADGHVQVPESWPKWKLKCGAKTRQGGRPCEKFAIRGMPTCRTHGSGGEANRQLGMLRYLCWIITGGPQNMPVELACRVALAVFAEAVLNRAEGTVDQQMKAAMWLTDLLE